MLSFPQAAPHYAKRMKCAGNFCGTNRKARPIFGAPADILENHCGKFCPPVPPEPLGLYCGVCCPNSKPLCCGTALLFFGFWLVKTAVLCYAVLYYIPLAKDVCICPAVGTRPLCVRCSAPCFWQAVPAPLPATAARPRWSVPPPAPLPLLSVTTPWCWVTLLAAAITLILPTPPWWPRMPAFCLKNWWRLIPICSWITALPARCSAPATR